MMHFRFTITHTPGKELVTADAPSRAPALSATEEDEQWNAKVQAYVNAIYNSLPATERRIQEIKDCRGM